MIGSQFSDKKWSVIPDKIWLGTPDANNEHIANQRQDIDFLSCLYIKRYLKKMTHPKSERRCFGALLGRVFHVQFTLSKGMLFDMKKEMK